MEHTVLEEKMGFQHGVVLGELMHAMVTARPDIAHSATILCKLSIALSDCHRQSSLEGLTKCLQTTKSWGMKHCRPKGEVLSDLPDSDCQEPAPLPEAVGEFTVNIAQPELIGNVDASCGSELQKQRSSNCLQK